MFEGGFCLSLGSHYRLLGNTQQSSEILPSTLSPPLRLPHTSPSAAIARAQEAAAAAKDGLWGGKEQRGASNSTKVGPDGTLPSALPSRFPTGTAAASAPPPGLAPALPPRRRCRSAPSRPTSSQQGGGCPGPARLLRQRRRTSELVGRTGSVSAPSPLSRSRSCSPPFPDRFVAIRLIRAPTPGRLRRPSSREEGGSGPGWLRAPRLCRGERRRRGGEREPEAPAGLRSAHGGCRRRALPSPLRRRVSQTPLPSPGGGALPQGLFREAKPAGTMTFQWMAVATVLYGEIAVLLVLCLPFISPLRWQKIFMIPLWNKMAAFWNKIFLTIIVLLIVLFLDAFREVRKYSSLQVNEKTANTNASTFDHIQMKLFRSQRNLYLSGFSLFLWLVLRRTVTLLTQLAKGMTSHAALETQVNDATEAAKKYMAENEKLRESLNEKESGKTKESAGETDKKLKKEVENLKAELQKTTEALQKANKEVIAVRKQSEGLQREYDRLLEEYGQLQDSLGKAEDKKEL